MSEPVGDGSMDGNKKMPSSNGDNNKEVLLRELQKSVHFVKTITSSNLPSFRQRQCVLALPLWFVRKHGDKFQQTVLLRSGLSTKPWRVQLTICNRPSKAPEVKFGGGWRPFAAFNGLIEGDDLLFSLSELSVFDVYIFRVSEKPNQPFAFQAPRNRPQDFEVSLEEVQKSGGCRDRQLSAERISEGSVDDLSNVFAKKRRGGEEGAIFAFHGRSTAGRLTSSNFDLHYLESRNLRDPSSVLCDSHQGQEPPVREHEQVEKPCDGECSAQRIGDRKSNANESKDKAVEETRKLPPSFLKRLKPSNFRSCKRAARLEIPKDFVRTSYAIGLRPPIVKLQGIHESSPVRIVVCKLWKAAGESSPSRLYLSDGWREFGDENGLKAGQELIFTLTADSFLVVRANS